MPTHQQREDRVFTPEQYHAYADGEAQTMLGVSFDAAWRQVESGELAGTFAEARLKLIQSLMPPTHLAAE